MANCSVADAKNTLPKLIDRALAGEEVVIARRGKPVVELRPSAPERSDPKAIHKWLAERRRGRLRVGITSVELLDRRLLPAAQQLGVAVEIPSTE